MRSSNVQGFVSRVLTLYEEEEDSAPLYGYRRMRSSIFTFFFFLWGGKMAKSFIDVVQDSPMTGLGVPVKTKKPPLSNQYTTRGTAFQL